MGARLAGKMAIVPVSASNIGRAVPAASVAEAASIKPAGDLAEPQLREARGRPTPRSPLSL